MSVGGLVVLAPRALISAIPVVLGNLLSGHFGGGNLQSHEQLLAVPGLACGVLNALRRFQGQMQAVLMGSLVVGALATYVVQGTTPGGGHFNPVTWTGMPWADSAHQLLENLGDAASAAAPAYLVDHLAEHPVAKVLDTHARPGDMAFVIIDRIPLSTAAHSAEEYEAARRDQFGWLTRRGYETVPVVPPLRTTASTRLSDIGRAAPGPWETAKAVL